jgi:hypothetical protein
MVRSTSFSHLELLYGDRMPRHLEGRILDKILYGLIEKSTSIKTSRILAPNKQMDRLCYISNKFIFIIIIVL